jgi:hypothetical protein
VFDHDDGEGDGPGLKVSGRRIDDALNRRWFSSMGVICDVSWTWLTSMTSSGMKECDLILAIEVCGETKS